MSLDKWQWSDAWVAVSMISTDNKYAFSLRDIIASGDYINHAVFNFDELAHGIAKLQALDYIKQKKEKFLLTDKFLNDFKEILLKHKNIIKLTDKIFEHLSTIEIKENQITKVKLIDKSSFESACKEYLEN